MASLNRQPKCLIVQLQLSETTCEVYVEKQFALYNTASHTYHKFLYSSSPAIVKLRNVVIKYHKKLLKVIIPCKRFPMWQYNCLVTFVIQLDYSWQAVFIALSTINLRVITFRMKSDELQGQA